MPDSFDVSVSNLFTWYTEVEEDEITSNKEWVKKIMEDELNWHGGIKAKHGLMSLKVSAFINLPPSSS